MNNNLLLADQDKEAIHTVLKEVVIALNNGDIEKLLSLHTDDVILMEPGMPLLQGHRNIKEKFVGFEKRKGVDTLDFETHELEVMGDRAFVRGSLIVTKIERDKDIKQASKGKFICLLKKQPHGRWLRTHVIVNGDGPADKF